jgi:hypothetical protein
MADQVLDARSQPAEPPEDDPRAKTHSYLRTAMAALLITIGVAVLHQTWQQGELLGSVSGYYYTPAQAVFVGGLMALGVAMIALRGTNPVEEVALNLGGMCAILVAVVPTSRNQEQRGGLEACEEAGITCPDLSTLEEATRANVVNNMVAALALGLFGMIAALWLVLRAGNRAGSHLSRTAFWWGLASTAAVWLCCAVTLLVSTGRFIEYAHHIAAVGLLGCLCVVALANAVGKDLKRQNKTEPDDVADALHTAGRALVSPKHSSTYAIFARAMIVAGVVGALLLLAERLLPAATREGLHTLFWVEIVVALLFILFWLFQTADLHTRRA